MFDKFIPYAIGDGVQIWQEVSKRLVESYGAWLDDPSYALATEYLEATTIKQAMKWLADEKQIPLSCLFTVPLKKPTTTSTYCYKQEEVEAIVSHGRADADLAWLGAVVVAGFRISELASLPWDDFAGNTIRLTDARHRAAKDKREQARATQNRRDRIVPIAQELRVVLDSIPRHSDGHVFHGPLGGVLSRIQCGRP